MTPPQPRKVGELGGIAENVRSQLLATASHDLARKIAVDGGSGLLAELLTDAAKSLAQLLAEVEALRVERDAAVGGHKLALAGLALLQAENARLRETLEAIRDSTYRSAIVLRAMADRGLRNVKPCALRDKESGE